MQGVPPIYSDKLVRKLKPETMVMVGKSKVRSSKSSGFSVNGGSGKMFSQRGAGPAKAGVTSNEAGGGSGHTFGVKGGSGHMVGKQTASDAKKA